MRSGAIRAWLPGVVVAVAGVMIPEAAAVAARGAGHLTLPPPAAAADYQLGGSYPLAPGVKIVSRDRTDPPARGAYNICYLNSFQTQASETSWWRSHHPEVLLRDHHREVSDPGWPGEVVFDTRTVSRRRTLMSVQGPWIDRCAQSGFSAVEPDNLDSYTRSHGLLSRRDNMTMAALVIGRSHQRDLAVGQKNTSELASAGPRLGFDFAVAEECQVYAECDAFTAAYGKRVIEIEYTDNGSVAFDKACRIRRGRASILLRDRNLTRPGDPAYVSKRC